MFVQKNFKIFTKGYLKHSWTACIFYFTLRDHFFITSENFCGWESKKHFLAIFKSLTNPKLRTSENRLRGSREGGGVWEMIFNLFFYFYGDTKCLRSYWTLKIVLMVLKNMFKKTKTNQDEFFFKNWNAPLNWEEKSRGAKFLAFVLVLRTGYSPPTNMRFSRNRMS